MKNILPLLFGAALLPIAAQAAESNVVGYTTQNLPANEFSLVGLNLQSTVDATGTVSAVAGAVVTAAGIDLSGLAGGATYIMEVTTAATPPGAEGTVQEFVTWDDVADTITLPGAVAGLAVGDVISVRKAPTLEEVFGTSPSVLTGSFVTLTADIVWLPKPMGGYDKYYLSLPLNEFKNADTGVATPNVPLVYTEGILIEKKGNTSSVTVTGEVKTTGSNSVLATGFNLVSIVAPAGLTLSTAGLEDDITSSFVNLTADVIWIPLGGNTYQKIWRKLPAGTWTDLDTGLDIVGDPVLPATILIQRKGAPTMLDLAVPASYSNL